MKYVAYYRLSTKSQLNGSGLDRQKEEVRSYVNKHGSLEAEYFEIRSGRKSEGTELNKALYHCQIEGACLVVEAVDRLPRRVDFVSWLNCSDINYIIAENPNISKNDVYVQTIAAEIEVEKVRKRSKAGMHRKMATGWKAGVNGKNVLSKANRKAANDFARKMIPVITRLKKEGYKTIMALTEEMNRRGIDTYTGSGRWHISSTHKLLNRIEEITNQPPAHKADAGAE